jgi:PilZ domain
MERRAHERYKVEFEVRLTVVDEQAHSALCHLSDISDSGISVVLPFQLTVGDLVELELADSTLYGHVVYSHPDNSSFRTGIEASRVLLGGSGLSRILEQVLTEALPSIPGLVPTESHFG